MRIGAKTCAINAINETYEPMSQKQINYRSSETVHQRLRLHRLAFGYSNEEMRLKIPRPDGKQVQYVSLMSPLAKWNSLTLTLEGGNSDNSWYASSRSLAFESRACSDPGINGVLSDASNATSVLATAHTSVFSSS
jgi:hypothetical protein